MAALELHDPLRALVPVDFLLIGGITAAVEIAPVKGVIAHAVPVRPLMKRTSDSLATLAAVGAGISILPGRIDLDDSQVGFAHGRSRERKPGREFTLQETVSHGVGVNNESRAHVRIFPETQTSEKPVTEQGSKEVKAHPCDDTESRATYEEQPRSSPFCLHTVVMKQGEDGRFQLDCAFDVRFSKFHIFPERERAKCRVWYAPRCNDVRPVPFPSLQNDGTGIGVTKQEGVHLQVKSRF
jgi:hypothetical protein